MRKVAFTAIAVLIFFVLVSVFLVIAETNYETHSASVNVKLVVHVLDVDQYSKIAAIKLFVFISHFPYEETDVNVQIIGAGSVIVSCNRTGQADGWYFKGESDQIEWLLEGDGEAFPFDSYVLRFRVRYINFIDPANFTLLTEEHQAAFGGDKAYSMNDFWKVENGLIPTKNIGKEEITFAIERSRNTLIVAVLQFLAPIFAGYYLLGSTLILDPKKRLGERLRIYLSLFAFVPTFLLAIQKFLPYRSSLSFPELLLINLVISNMIFGIVSIIGSSKGVDKLEVVQLHQNVALHNKWDLVGVSLSLFFFAFAYMFTLFGKMTIQTSLVLSYIILPAYLYYIPFMLRRKKFAECWRLYLSLGFPFLISVIILIALWLLTK